MAAGIGLAGVLSGFVPNSSSFNSFIIWFNSDCGRARVQMIIIISALAVAFCFHERILLMSFLIVARCVGVHKALINFGFVIAVALVAVAARTVRLLSSMMVVPVACALQISAAGSNVHLRKRCR